MPGYRICCTCKQRKRLQAFNFKYPLRNKRHTKCKMCMREYSRQHYLKNKEYYKAKAHNTEKKRRTLQNA